MMREQDDLENGLANSSLSGSSTQVSEISVNLMGEQDDLENRFANSSHSGSSTQVSEISVEGLVEKVGGAEVEGDMFRNIWHEYLFIFVVTSAQLITVSSNCHCHLLLARANDMRNVTYSKLI